MALSAVIGILAAVMYLNPSAPFDVSPATVIVIATALGGAFIFFLLMRVQRRRGMRRKRQRAATLRREAAESRPLHDGPVAEQGRRSLTAY